MSKRRKKPLSIEKAEPAICGVDLRYQILGDLPFFEGLSKQSLEEVNRYFREHGYSAGETIYFSGDPAARLFVVAMGRVKLMQHTLQGQDVALELLTSGDFFGALSQLGEETFPDTAYAITDCCVLAIPADSFQRILEDHPSVGPIALRVMAKRLQKAHEIIRQLSALPVDQRVASTLVRLADKFGQPDEVGFLIQLPLSRQDLAQMTGSTPETVSRVLSEFKREGLIRTGREWVALLDQDALTRLFT